MAFRFDKLTVKAQEAVAAAQSSALEMTNPEFDTLHLLKALLADRDSIVVPLLKKIGSSPDQLSALCDSELKRLPRAQGGREPRLSGALRNAFEAAAKCAETMKDEYGRTGLSTRGK